jgi:hypothetical protein
MPALEAQSSEFKLQHCQQIWICGISLKKKKRAGNIQPTDLGNGNISRELGSICLYLTTHTFSSSLHSLCFLKLPALPL